MNYFDEESDKILSSSTRQLFNHWKKDTDFENIKKDTNLIIHVASLHGKYVEILNKVKMMIYYKEISFKKKEVLKRKHYQGQLSNEIIKKLGWALDPFSDNARPERINKTNLDKLLENDPYLNKIKKELIILNNDKTALEYIVPQIQYSLPKLLDAYLQRKLL